MRFEGRVVRVEVQQVTNKWKYTVTAEDKLVRKQEPVPVITLDDGDGTQVDTL